MFWGWWGRRDSNPGFPAFQACGYAPQAGVIAKLDHGPTGGVSALGKFNDFENRSYKPEPV